MAPYNELVAYCRTQDNGRLPSQEELISMYVNRNLLNLNSVQLITTTQFNIRGTTVYQIHFPHGIMSAANKTDKYNGWCVKRN